MAQGIERAEREMVRAARDYRLASRWADEVRAGDPDTYRRRKAYRDATSTRDRASAALHGMARVVAALTGVRAGVLIDAAMKVERMEYEEMVSC